MNETKMNDSKKVYMPLLLVIFFIVCMVTGVIISNNYLKETNKVNQIIEEDVPKLEIDSEKDNEELNDNENTEDINNNNESQLDTEDNVSTEENNTNDNQSNNTQNNNQNNNTPNQNNNNQSNTNQNSTSKPSSSSKPSTNNNSSSSNNSSNSNTNNNQNNSGSSNNNSTPSTPSTPTPEPTQEELNNSYRNSIYSTYGVKVTYANEMGDYLVGYYTPTKMTDPIEINEYLGRIESELKKYPSRFFKEIRDFGMPLTVYLVKDIPGSDIAGLTNSQFYSNIVISIKGGLLFEKTLNHELMHYIDSYLNTKLYPETVETEWNKLNPEGFTYGLFISTYDYFPSQNNNAYFFNTYSQTNYKEDRATIFEDIMTRAYKRPCYNVGYPLYNKIKLLAEQIDAGFESVNSSTVEYWEKYL